MSQNQNSLAQSRWEKKRKKLSGENNSAPSLKIDSDFSIPKCVQLRSFFGIETKSGFMPYRFDYYSLCAFVVQKRRIKKKHTNVVAFKQIEWTI